MNALSCDYSLLKVSLQRAALERMNYYPTAGEVEIMSDNLTKKIITNLTL